MNESNVALRDLVRAIQQNSLCAKKDSDFKDKLLKKVQDIEDKAFKKTAGAISPWICHPIQLKSAEKWTKKLLKIDTINYPKI